MDQLKEEDLAVTFSATFKKAYTGADGGWVLSLDLEETAGEDLSDRVRIKGRDCQVAISPHPDK